MRAGADGPGRVRRGRGHRPALRALHLRHDRQAQGHRARQRRPRGRDGLVAAEHLRRAPGPGLVDRLRRRLGRRPLLHRLRAADQRRDDGALRGQAGRHAGRRRVLAGDRRARRRGAVHRADRDPGDQEGGPRRRRCSPTTTSSRFRDAVPGRGAARPRHLRTGPPSSSASRSSTTGGRPRPAGRSRRTCAASSRCRSSPARRRCRCPATTWRCSTTSGAPVPGGQEGAICLRLPLPPGTLPTLWGDDERFVVVVPLGLRRLLPVRRRRLRRRGRLPLRDGPHRRRHQRGRAPASTGSMEAVLAAAPGGRGVRGDRGGRPAEGSGAARLRGAQGRRRPTTPTSIGRELVARVRDEIGAVAAFQRRHRRRRAAEDPLAGRSCARRCARSPTARTPAVPSTIEDAGVLDALRPSLRHSRSR